MFMYAGVLSHPFNVRYEFFFKAHQATAVEYFSHYVKNESTVLEGGPRRG